MILGVYVQTYTEPNYKATHCLSMRVATRGCTFRGNLYNVLTLIVCDFIECEVCDVIENHHHRALTFDYDQLIMIMV